LRVFRYGTFPRVNQFDVEHSLEGLEEKFRVYNKDSLADALRERLDELSEHRTKWTPEILHLLLELSDRPVHKSKLEDLEFLKPPEVHAEPILKWRDLVKEDPLLRDKIWKNIDYAAESSEDEAFSEDDVEHSIATETTLSSLNEEGVRKPEDLAISIDSEGLKWLQEEQFWKNIKETPINIVDAYFEKPKTAPITELQAIRETLFMLRGLPTSLYSVDNSAATNGERAPVQPTTDYDSGTIQPVSGFILSGISSDVFYDTLSRLSSYGTSLRHLRTWIPIDKAEPLMQMVQQQIRRRLQEFDELLSELEGKYVAPKSDVVVSIAEIHTAVASHIEPFQALTKLVRENHKWIAYRWLEALYDATCTVQMAGNDKIYEVMGTMFFNCFEIYLRPLRKWMEDGDLSPGFFIKKSQQHADSISLWEKYIIEQDQNGSPKQMPRFFSTAAHNILTSGKSVVVLKHLGQYAFMRRSWTSKEPRLDFQTVCGSQDAFLLPFPELFDAAFEAWVQSKHHATSSTLRRCLFEDCGLSSSLDALENIYFMSDGATSGALASTIFDDLSRGKSTWNDRFNLTELARSTLGQLSGVVADSLRISIKPIQPDVLLARRTVKSLFCIQLFYHLPWAVSLIIHPSTFSTYQRLSTFLLQIRRASYTLTSSRLLESSEPALYYGLRVKLLWFSNTLHNYITDLVIGVNTERMRQDMARAGDIDAMVACHGAYVRKLYDQAMLGKRLELIHKTILSILDLAISLEDARAVNAARSSNSPAKKKAGSESEEESEEESGEGSDSDEDGEREEQEFSILPDQEGMPYDERLKDVEKDYERLTRFVLAGLRGVARTGAESMWDVLAEKLEFGLGTGQRQV